MFILPGSTSDRLHVQCWEILCVECFLAKHEPTDSGHRRPAVNLNMVDLEACTDTVLSTTQVGTDERTDERMKERNVLFNDALNTFYLQLYGVRHMV